MAGLEARAHPGAAAAVGAGEVLAHGEAGDDALVGDADQDLLGTAGGAAGQAPGAARVPGSKPGNLVGPPGAVGLADAGGGVEVVPAASADDRGALPVPGCQFPGPGPMVRDRGAAVVKSPIEALGV